MVSKAPMIVLDKEFLQACFDGRLMNIIATSYPIQSRQSDNKLDPANFPQQSCRCRLILLSNIVFVTEDVIVSGLSYETPKFLVEKGAVDADASVFPWYYAPSCLLE